MASYPPMIPTSRRRRASFLPNASTTPSVTVRAGSVFKIFNYSAAFETTSLTPEHQSTARRVIRSPQDDHDSHLGTECRGELRLRQVFECGRRPGRIAVAKNTCTTMSTASASVNAPAFPACRKPRQAANRESLEQGVAGVPIYRQEVSVTTLQLAQAVCAIANAAAS